MLKDHLSLHTTFKCHCYLMQYWGVFKSWRQRRHMLQHLLQQDCLLQCWKPGKGLDHARGLSH